MNLTPVHSSAQDPALSEFAQLYVDLRQQENRMYSDEEVAWLPEISEDHVHRKEWEIRKSSCKKLLDYLRHKKRSLNILEVGCGNGWLSYQLSQMPYSHVVGLDVNIVELQQAERVFAAIPNLNFAYGDIYSSVLPIEKFDVIVFAASIQYFQFFADIMNTALNLLTDKGEVHLIDSHFYSPDELETARQRSCEYFHANGFGKMEEFYFHHSISDLKTFKYYILYDPHSTLNKLLRKKNPFYWVCIKK